MGRTSSPATKRSRRTLGETNDGLRVASDRLRRTVEGIRNDPDRPRLPAPIEQFERRNHGDEEANGWCDEVKGHRQPDGAEVADGLRPIDLQGAEPDHEAAVVIRYRH